MNKTMIKKTLRPCPDRDDRMQARYSVQNCSDCPFYCQTYQPGRWAEEGVCCVADREVVLKKRQKRPRFCPLRRETAVVSLEGKG